MVLENGAILVDNPGMREVGIADEASYGSYLKMEKEKAHFGSTTAERRKKDRAFGKMLDVYKKESGRWKP